jgi:hypothetical protein
MLDLEWRPMDKNTIKQIISGAGLIGDFWKLDDSPS